METMVEMWYNGDESFMIVVVGKDNSESILGTGMETMALE